MAGSQGMPTSVASQQGQPQSTPSVFNMANQPSADIMSPAVMPTQPSMGGGKGAGPMQPQRTAMGTPIVYGNVYSSETPASISNQAIPSAPVEDNSFMYAAADGTTSVPGYAKGTTEVEDPWDWANKAPVAPLAVTIKPSEAVIPQVVPDQTEQQLGQMGMGIATNAAAKGIDAAYKAYNAPLTTQAVSSIGKTASGAPVALTNMGASTTAAPASSSLYALNAPASIGGAVQGVSPVASSVLPTVVGAGEVAAPLGSSLAGLSTGVAAAEGATLAGAGTAATGAASGAALAGGEAALAALGPVGMVIGGALLAKKLGIF